MRITNGFKVHRAMEGKAAKEAVFRVLPYGQAGVISIRIYDSTRIQSRGTMLAALTLEETRRLVDELQTVLAA